MRTSHELPFWRELTHPGEQRGWRCRPEPEGVRVEFCDAEEPTWSGRLVRLRRDARPGESPVMAREAGLAASVPDALEWIAAQLAEGFVESSPPPEAQLLGLLEEVWRTESRHDVSDLVAAARAGARTREVSRWLVDAAATIPEDGTTAHLSWWPEPVEPARREASLAALRAHGLDATTLLLLALRMPALSGAIAARDALAGAGELGDRAFELVLDRLSPGPAFRGEFPLATSALARAFAVTDGRVAALRSALAETRGQPPFESDPTAHLSFSAGMEIALFLAEWAADPRAADVIRAFAPVREAQLCWAVLRGAQRAPGTSWTLLLRSARPLFAKLSRTYVAELDAALAACGPARAARELTSSRARPCRSGPSA